MGAAHVDTITRLVAPVVRARTNPVRATLTRPGGVANNIATRLANIGARVTLYCPPPARQVIMHLKQLGIVRRNLGTHQAQCNYTAILSPSGELEIGVADMETYDQMGAKFLPKNFLSKGTGTLILDASFSPQLLNAAANQARLRGWQVIGAATSTAKVSRMQGIDFALFVLNEAEAKIVAGNVSRTNLARKIAKQTQGWVAVTLGSDGAILATNQQLLWQKPPQHKLSDTVGAGDAFTAVLAAAHATVQQGYATAAQALSLAVAAGSCVVADFASARENFMQSISNSLDASPPMQEFVGKKWVCLRNNAS